MGSDLVFLLQKFCHSNCSSTQSTAACYSDLAVGLLRIGEEGEEEREEEGEGEGEGKGRRRRGRRMWCRVGTVYACNVLCKKQFPVFMHRGLATNPMYLQHSTGLPDPVSSPSRRGDPHLISRRHGLLIIAHCLALVVINWKSGRDQVKGQ